MQDAVYRIRGIARSCDDYEELRVKAFKLIGVNKKAATEFDLSDATTLKFNVAFEPKIILFYKDTWRCDCAQTARRLLLVLARYKEVSFIQFSGRWLRVDYYPKPGADHIIPGQELEDRSKLRGL